eukprot:Hpha_TRINITY_DN28915_c0_g1::TRINITY_DN28915_c0_g1_i1::g.19451::m.19451
MDVIHLDGGQLVEMLKDEEFSKAEIALISAHRSRARTATGMDSSPSGSRAPTAGTAPSPVPVPELVSANDAVPADGLPGETTGCDTKGDVKSSVIISWRLD